MFQKSTWGTGTLIKVKASSALPYQDCPDTGVIPKDQINFQKLFVFFLPKDLGLTLYVQNYKLSL